MHTSNNPALRELAQRVRVQTNGTHARAMLTLPNGRTVQCMIRCDTPEALAGELDALMEQGLAGGDDELAGFVDKLKKVAKKATIPLKAVHKLTHKGVIGKMEKKVQDAVSKYLPIAKPFIDLHKKIASPIHKLIEGKKIKKVITAKAIADVTKSIPDLAQRAGVQKALVATVQQKEKLQAIAKTAVKAKVISEAVRVAKAGAPGEKVQAKAFLKKAVALRAAQKTAAARPTAAPPAAATAGATYEVRTPSGRVIKIPASKVA